MLKYVTKLTYKHCTFCTLLALISLLAMSSIATAAAEVTGLRTNLTKAIKAVRELKDWSDDETITPFPYSYGPAGLFAALLCICEKILDPSGSRAYPKFADEHAIDEDLLQGCVSLCKKQAHFQRWFTPTGMQGGGNTGPNFTMNLTILTEWESATPLSMDENVRIRLVHVIYGCLMTKPDVLVPKFRSWGGCPCCSP